MSEISLKLQFRGGIAAPGFFNIYLHLRTPMLSEFYEWVEFHQSIIGVNVIIQFYCQDFLISCDYLLFLSLHDSHLPNTHIDYLDLSLSLMKFGKYQGLFCWYQRRRSFFLCATQFSTITKGKLEPIMKRANWCVLADWWSWCRVHFVIVPV